SATGGGAGDNFGKAVSLDGNRLLVAAHLADAGSTNDAGAAYVFDYASNDWTEKVKLTALVPLTPATATHSLGDHRARFRDDETGRWVTRDSFEYVDSLNMYELLVSNPFKWLDYTGNEIVGPPAPSSKTSPYKNCSPDEKAQIERAMVEALHEIEDLIKALKRAIADDSGDYPL